MTNDKIVNYKKLTCHVKKQTHDQSQIINKIYSKKLKIT